MVMGIRLDQPIGEYILYGYNVMLRGKGEALRLIKQQHLNFVNR
jgi:hypothetical protein